MILYYNCIRVMDVLRARCIQTSKVHRGVSLSANFDMASHGSFKVAFKAGTFQGLREMLYMYPVASCSIGSSGRVRFPQVTGYTDQHGKNWSLPEYHTLMQANVAKNPMFRDEQEWWSCTELRFREEDVLRVSYMTNAPCVQPRVRDRNRRELQLYYPDLYEEIQVNDPYLAKAS